MNDTAYPSDRQWIQTFTGRQFYPLNPVTGELAINDIAHALACKCRFTGHTLQPYSIAQHSVHVSHAVSWPDALWGLLHDATEAYLPDVARPIKNELFVRLPARDGHFVQAAQGWQLVTFAQAERQLMGSICRRFGLPYEMPASVKEADVRMLATERRDLMARSDHGWGDLDAVAPYPEPVEAWDWRTAEAAFLQRFHELAGV